MPAFALFRAYGRPRLLPLNLTISFSFRCNSRCKTCNIHRKETPELNHEEWKRIFANYGRNLFWATISGGEPFLRKDLTSLVGLLYDHCRPSIINIPTNGFLTDGIVSAIADITEYCRRSQIIVNLSIDDIGARHDEIRGLPGSSGRALETFRRLKSMHAPNLSVGIHTVISRFNAQRMPIIAADLAGLEPDSYIAEIAEEREELGTIGAKIAPDIESFSRAAFHVVQEQASMRPHRLGSLTRSFRQEYYFLAERILRRREQVLPCYCGFASAHIAPNGDVWMCCIKAEPAGNLRESGFSFRKIWLSPGADDLRRSIRAGRCYCPLANAAYVNMLFSPRTLARIVWHLLRSA